MRVRLTKFSAEQEQDLHDISLINTANTSIIGTATIDKHAIADIPTIHMPILSKTAVDQESLTQLDTLIDTALYLAPFGAFLAWCLSLQAINIRQMNDLGLVSVFPPLLLGTIVFITACFCILLYRKRIRISALCVYFALLIIMLYGVNTLIEEMSISMPDILNILCVQGQSIPHSLRTLAGLASFRSAPLLRK